MSDAVKMKDSHIFYSQEGYFFEGLDYQYLSMKVGILVIKELNYFDLNYLRRIANLFHDEIIKLKSWWTLNNGRTGYKSIPLLRVFSLFLSKYLFTNIALIEEKQELDSNADFKEVASKLLKDLFHLLKEKEIEHLFEIAIKVTTRSLGFNDEISCEKWVNYGIELGHLPKLTSGSLSYYFNDKDFVLVQLLMLFSSSSKMLFKSFIEGYSVDGSIEHIFTNMVFVPDEFVLNAEDLNKDVSNLKHFLYLLNSVISNDRLILFQSRPYSQQLSHE